MKRKLDTEIDREMIIAKISHLELKKYSIDIIRRIIRRTINQNSLYWLWITCIEAETGNDRNDLHDFFKQKFLIPEIILVFNHEQERLSTINLNTLQFKNYLDKIQGFAMTELSIRLPDPEDQYWEEFYSYYSDKL